MLKLKHTLYIKDGKIFQKPTTMYLNIPVTICGLKLLKLYNLTVFIITIVKTNATHLNTLLLTNNQSYNLHNIVIGIQKKF